jgi:hypothetical protein
VAHQLSWNCKTKIGSKNGEAKEKKVLVYKVGHQNDEAHIVGHQNDEHHTMIPILTYITYDYPY